MILEKRKSPRFEDIGRVEAAAVCAVPGVLDDVSTGGFCAHFPVRVDIDMECDCEVTLRPSSLAEFTGCTYSLIARPQWKIDGRSGSRIGFSLLRSPDTPKYNLYIDALAQKNLEFSSLLEPVAN